MLKTFPVSPIWMLRNTWSTRRETSCEESGRRDGKREGIVKLGIHQGFFSPPRSASSLSSCILQAARELEESTTRIVCILLMIHIIKGLCAHPERGNPESRHLSGTSQAQIVWDLRGMAEAMKCVPLTPALAQGQHVSSVCHATGVRELR